MKALYLDVEPITKGSVSVKEIKTRNLNDQFHFHNAHEIALILKGSGKRIVGDNIENFTDGDLVFIGRLLPHASYIGEDYMASENFQEVHALVVYFHPEWFDRNILNSADFMKFMKLIDKLERGIKILGHTKTRTIKALLRLKNSRGLERIVKLLDILDFVSKSEEYKCLASEGYSNSYSKSDVERLSAVYKHIMKNFSDVIRLDEISAIANMAPTSFCKYFKSKTGKTFANFVNEVRIGQACKLFFNENLNISQVCYSCGFNNLTSFNKNFKHFSRMTPTEYRKNLNL
jgi:AraC-like DNA-binding protein